MRSSLRGAFFFDFCLRQRSLLLQIPNQQALRSYRCSAAFPFPRALKQASGIFAFGKDPSCSKFRTNKPCAAIAAQRLFHFPAP